jgi:predicted RNA-binding Zn-ribbon protein involved in translation (DUF1610 family)
MMDEVTVAELQHRLKIDRKARERSKVRLYTCPGCGWCMDIVEWTAARYNFECPGCSDHRLSDYRMREETEGA